MPNSSASSPSEAYAGLCLDSIEEPTAETMTGMSADTSRRDDSLTLEENNATASKTSAVNVNGDAQAEGTRSRSQSPAKRRVEEMENDNGTDEVGQMEIDGSTAPLRNGHSSTAAQSVRQVFPPLRLCCSRVGFLKHSLNLRALSISFWRPLNSNCQNLSISMLDYTVQILTVFPQLLNSSSDRETRDKSVDMLGATQAQTEGAAPSAAGPDKDLPSIDEQVKTIMEQMAASQSDTRNGDVGYAVSMAWLNRVLARSSSSNDHGPFDKSVLEGEIGPIDNSAILLSSESKGAARHINFNSRLISHNFWQS